MTNELKALYDQLEALASQRAIIDNLLWQIEAYKESCVHRNVVFVSKYSYDTEKWLCKDCDTMVLRSPNTDYGEQGGNQ